MDNDLEEFPEKPEELEVIYSRHGEWIHLREGKLSLKDKLIIGGLAVGGIAVGTVLFLFFLTLFLYVFLPVTLLFIVWNLLKHRKSLK